MNAGVVWSLAGHNSCSADRLDYLSVFSPRGAFPLQRATNKAYTRYSEDESYIFCTMDATWALPTYDTYYVEGFDTVEGSYQIDCAQPKPNGVISLRASDCGGFVETYPDPTVGIIASTGEGITAQTTNDTAKSCPGNTLELVCFRLNKIVDCNTCASLGCDYGPGRPKNLCSFCLNTWRRATGLTTGPDISYSHCPYSESLGSGMDFWCGFCPGRGYGWLASELYTKNALIVVFWLATTYCLFLPPLEYLVMLLLAYKRKMKNN